MSNERLYNDPANSSPSEIGTQIRTDHYWKRALIEARKEIYFMNLADVASMPKHAGKKLKRNYYVPLLDDRNINDEGIDAAGVATETTNYYVSYPRAVLAIANASKAAATRSRVNASLVFQIR